MRDDCFQFIAIVVRGEDFEDKGTFSYKTCYSDNRCHEWNTRLCPSDNLPARRSSPQCCDGHTKASDDGQFCAYGVDFVRQENKEQFDIFDGERHCHCVVAAETRPNPNRKEVVRKWVAPKTYVEHHAQYLLESLVGARIPMHYFVSHLHF